MRKEILIVIFTLLGTTAFADYDPTPLPQLIIESDVILEGEIIDQDSLTFTLKIIDWIKGDSITKNITIEKFEDWTCANRIIKYEIGQKEIVFLLQHKKTKKWISMGAGNEGELLIQNDSITYEDIYWDSKSGCVKIDYFGQEVCGWKYTLKDFKEGIEFYISEFPRLKSEYKTENKIENRLKGNSPYKRMIYESFNFFLFGEME
jgi:hypothetical protein